MSSIQEAIVQDIFRNRGVGKPNPIVQNSGQQRTEGNLHLEADARRLEERHQRWLLRRAEGGRAGGFNDRQPVSGAAHRAGDVDENGYDEFGRRVAGRGAPASSANGGGAAATAPTSSSAPVTLSAFGPGRDVGVGVGAGGRDMGVDMGRDTGRDMGRRAAEASRAERARAALERLRARARASGSARPEKDGNRGPVRRSRSRSRDPAAQKS